MKNKKTLFGIILFISFGFLFNINSVAGYTGDYEKRTDPTNPFIFTIDILYYDNDFGVTEIEEMFHQVFLKEETFYLIYISCGILYSGDYDMMKIHLGSDDSVDYLYTGFEQRYQGKSIYLFKPTETGFYNITIRLGLTGFDSWSSMQIGVLELPSVNLNKVVDWNQWDFDGNAITAIRINLEAGNYEIGGLTEDGTPWSFPGAEVHYKNLANYYTHLNLFELKEDGNHLNGTEEIYLSSGEYIFYSFSADWFGIRESIEPDNLYETTDDSYILGNLIVFGIITIAIVGVVIIGYIIFKKSRTKAIIKVKEIPKIYCPECGVEIPDRDKIFCSKCGSKIIK